MSRIIGIINTVTDPNSPYYVRPDDPQYYHKHWLWRPQHAIPWEHDELIIHKIPVESGNVEFRIIGALPAGHTGPNGYVGPHGIVPPCKCPKCLFFDVKMYASGMFLKWQCNADLKPEIYLGQEAEVLLQQPSETLLNSPNPHSDEPARPTEPFSGLPPLIPAPDMVQPLPSQKEQLVAQIAKMLETLKALS